MYNAIRNFASFNQYRFKITKFYLLFSTDSMLVSMLTIENRGNVAHQTLIRHTSADLHINKEFILEMKGTGIGQG